jgi:NADH:ubiquinone oxidoreductase subunit K
MGLMGPIGLMGALVRRVLLVITANGELLLDHFQLQIVPERFGNLNAAVSLLVGFD